MSAAHLLLPRALVAGAWLAITLPVLGASRAELNAQLDIDGNQKLDYGEVLLGLRHKTAPAKVNLPKIKNIDKKLPADLYTDKELHTRYLIFIEPQPGKKRPPPPYTLTQFDAAEFGLEKAYEQGLTSAEKAERRDIPDVNWKLRRTKDDLAKADGDPLNQGAIFSYGRNYNTDQENWTARGIVALSYSLKENLDFDPYAQEREAQEKSGLPAGKSTLPARAASAPAFLRAIDGLFTVQFDKVNVGGGALGEVNSLIFGGGIVLDLNTGSPQARRGRGRVKAGQDAGDVSLLQRVTVDLSGKWATDFDLEKQIYGGEIDVTPWFDLPGSGSYGHLITWGRSDGTKDTLLACRWSMVLHAEAGTIEEPAPANALHKSNEFARAGARGNIEFLILPDLLKQRLSAGASFLHYEGIMSDTQSSRLFRASAQYVMLFDSGLEQETESGALLPRDARATLRIEYQEGEIPFVQEEDRSLLLGLAVYF